MTRAEVLKRAEELVCKERAADYGELENNFDLIARLWNAYITANKIPLKAVDVAVLMILLKVARQISGNGKLDNWIDIAGYAACGGELELERGGV